MISMDSLIQSLWEKHHERLYTVAYRILLNQQDSEDTVSEAFLRLSEKTDRYTELDENKTLRFSLPSQKISPETS